MHVTDARMGPAAAERMPRLVASGMGVELSASAPSLAAKLPPPFSETRIPAGTRILRNKRARLADPLFMVTAETVAPRRMLRS